MAAQNKSRKVSSAFRKNMQQDLTGRLSGYLRTGAKENRQRQHKCMSEFVGHCERLGARSLGQIGGSHVVKFWKANRHLEDRTLEKYWYAILTLWDVTGLPGEPPKFWTKAMRQTVEAARAKNDLA